MRRVEKSDDIKRNSRLIHTSPDTRLIQLITSPCRSRILRIAIARRPNVERALHLLRVLENSLFRPVRLYRSSYPLPPLSVRAGISRIAIHGNNRGFMEKSYTRTATWGPPRAIDQVIQRRVKSGHKARQRSGPRFCPPFSALRGLTYPFPPQSPFMMNRRHLTVLRFSSRRVFQRATNKSR